MPDLLDRIAKEKPDALDRAATQKGDMLDRVAVEELPGPEDIEGFDVPTFADPSEPPTPEGPGLIGRGFKQFINRFFIEPARTFLAEGGPGKLDTALRLAEFGATEQKRREREGVEPKKPRKFSLRELGATIRDSNKLGIKLKEETRRAAEEAVPGFEIPKAETIPEKAVDVVAGVTAFIGRLAITKKFLGAQRGDFLGSVFTWETENIATGGTPGTGAAMRLALGGIDSIPAATMAGKTLKLGAESSLFGGLTAASGGDWEDVAISALIPLGFKAWNSAARGVAKGRTKRAIKNLRTEVKKYGIDLNNVPDQALDIIINAGKQANFWNKQHTKGKVSSQVYEQRLTQIRNQVKPIFEAIGRQQPAPAKAPTTEPTVAPAKPPALEKAGVKPISPVVTGQEAGITAPVKAVKPEKVVKPLPAKEVIAEKPQEDILDIVKRDKAKRKIQIEKDKTASLEDIIIEINADVKSVKEGLSPAFLRERLKALTPRLNDILEKSPDAISKIVEQDEKDIEINKIILKGLTERRLRGESTPTLEQREEGLRFVIPSQEESLEVTKLLEKVASGERISKEITKILPERPKRIVGPVEKPQEAVAEVEVAIIPGTQIKYDNVRTAFDGKNNWVIFEKDGKSVHKIKVRNAPEAEKLAKDFRGELKKAVPAVKPDIQPFQLTKAEFTGTDAEHKKLVIQAVRVGKDVPIKVLEDYPNEKWSVRAIARAKAGIKLRPSPKPAGPEVVITKFSEAATKIPKAPKEPVTENPLIPLRGKEAQVFREEVRTRKEITEAEAGEVGIEPAGTSFTEHIDTFQSYQLPQTSQIPQITKQMKKVNGLRLAGKITPVVANKRIHKLRQLLIQQAIKEKIALRVSKKGKVKIALRESGVFVPVEFATYTKYKDIEPMLGGGQDITRAIQQMDGALPIKEKLKVKGQAGPIEQFVLWRTRRMTVQKLNWLKEKTIEIRGILSAKKGSVKDKEINRVLEKIGTADRDAPIKDVLGKKTLASFSKESVKSAQELRQFYDDLIEEQTAARRMRGQDEIPYRQNYSPHILRDTTVWEQLFLRDKTAKILEKKDLPDYIKPNAPFNPRAQAREADIPYDKRVLSARELAESYIITASKDIFNTSIVQNNKAFIDQLRGQGFEKSAEYLAEWTATSYAGIKPRLDRAVKLPKWAAGGLRYFNRLRNMAVFPLNVAWSLSTQPLSLSNTIGRYGVINTTRGFYQWLKPSIRKQAAQEYYSFIIKSTKRGGVTKQDASNLLGENIKIQKTTGEFIENFTTILLTEMEKLLTGTSIRAARITGEKRGLTGEALKNFASDGGGKTQSMYNDEDKPMILRSLLVKSGAPYQTYAFEVANTFREWAGRTGTPPDTKLYAMWSVTRWLAALTVLKMIANTVRGKRWSWWDLIPIPFREFWLTPIVRKLTGEFVPGSSGLPSPVETGARVAKGINDVLETGSWRKLRNEMIRYGPGVFGIPGGVQWSRMVDAIITYSSGGLRDRRGREMFEMKDPNDLARAMFTGVWTTKEAQALLEKRHGKKKKEPEPVQFKFIKQQ